MGVAPAKGMGKRRAAWLGEVTLGAGTERGAPGREAHGRGARRRCADGVRQAGGGTGGTRQGTVTRDQ